MATERDTFDKARTGAAACLVAAAVAAILGTLLNWVTNEPPAIIPIAQVPRTEPFTGMETKSAPYILIAAGAVILLALLIVTRKRPLYAWLAFGASMTMGAIAVQNFRGLDELFYDQMERIGDPSPGLGLMLVAAGGVAGIIASATAVAALPSAPKSRADDP